MGLTVGIALLTGYCLGVLPAIFNPYNPSAPLLFPARGLTIAALYFPLALALRRRFTNYSLSIIAVTLASAGAATGLLLALIPESEPEIGSISTALFAVTLAIAVAVALVGAVVDIPLIILTVSSIMGTLAAIIGNFAGLYGATYSGVSSSIFFVAIISIPVLILLFGLLLSFYPGSPIIQNQTREPLLRTLALMFSTSIAGTRFNQANLTNANFSNTSLQNVNFKKAILTGTNFHNARQLHRVLCSERIMSNDQMCE
ncbi:MAG: pentapeptide repeat-containing protein [Cyanobacteria bacterium P01_H01_bin.15]